MALLFKSTKSLEVQIDEFLDAVSEGGIVFKKGIENYLEGDAESFEARLETISKLEKKADDLRRTVENQLYTHSLIPEHRGDVLALLESMDNVIDAAKNSLIQFSIEKPEMLAELNDEYLELADGAANATEAIVRATRAFFRDINAVKDHIHKVYFFEKEADRIANRLKRHIFGLDIDLSRKMHFGSVVANMDHICDRAQDVADRLSIYAIKRVV